MNDSHDMDMDKELIKEIQHYAGKLPPERQERILEVIRAMLFTRKKISGREAKNWLVRGTGDMNVYITDCRSFAVLSMALALRLVLFFYRLHTQSD